MPFMDALKTCFAKYATFSGRAARSEFWWFMLFLWLGMVVLSYVDTLVFGARDVVMMTGTDSFETGMGFSFNWQPQPITAIFILATIVPNLAVGARRLHDGGRTGWWWLIALIPMLGFIVLLIFFIPKGTGGENQYGPDPLG